MATVEKGESGHEEVEGVQGAADNVETALDQPPPPTRRTRPSSGRPRPISMPPVASEPLNGLPAPEQHDQRTQPIQPHSSSSRRGTSRATVRVIGNYSLGKTLGAGSMGKVKLAYHNQTGEKVRLVSHPLYAPLTVPAARYQNSPKTKREPFQLGHPHSVFPRSPGRKGCKQGNQNRP
jgi:serine/threonine protein kinase KIN1/2